MKIGCKFFEIFNDDNKQYLDEVIIIHSLTRTFILNYNSLQLENKLYMIDMILNLIHKVPYSDKDKAIEQFINLREAINEKMPTVL